MRIAISGSHGLIGTAIVEALEQRGDQVTRISRNEIPDLSAQDAVINLAGASIAGRLWTKKYRQEILNSRVAVTKNLVTALNLEAAKGRALTFLSGSAVGFYGSRASEQLTETSPPGTGFLADVVLSWEAEAAAAAAIHRTVLLRTGHVFASKGGILAPQRLIFKAGLGGPIGSGTQFMPWIMLTDYVRAILYLLDNSEVAGPVNMCSPNPVRQREFAKAFAKSLSRPALLTAPAFAPKLIFGESMVEELLLASQNAVPEALQTQGFEFLYPEVYGALRELG